MQKSFLIESCLLTHGLLSVSDEDMAAVWPHELDNIAWIDKGHIIIGGMEEYLPFRNRAKEVCRIDMYQVERAKKEKISGALTASGTMEVCRLLGLPLAVTCGMGGLGDIPEEELCPDLPALAELPVALISTSPKDMLDIAATIGWLIDHGVAVIGNTEPLCTGYIFNSARVDISKKAEDPFPSPHQLLLNPIPIEDRVEDKNILHLADAVGREAAARGEYYHPAVNGAIDKMTAGHSSRIQLSSLIANALLAQKLFP